ncbi:MAG: response regulator [Terracidiphilus sp.]|nr:response regulator [Terracidiphilus sp.]
MKRILFVDDESRVLDGLRRMLYAERKRWEIEFALGGEAALQACEVEAFDVVVSDMRMPGMDGATLLGHIRDRYPSSARVILSGYAEPTLSTRAVSVAHRFLAKPCNASELQSIIDRLCALQDLLCAPELRRIVGTIGQLPSLSNTYTSLTQAVRDPDASVDKVADIIEQDVAMAAKVLQLVNSAFFGLARRVTTLQTAVGYLGMETIKNLALASEAFRVFVPHPRVPLSAFEAVQLHAHRSAAIVAVLPMEPAIRDATVVAALLHDVGNLVLGSALPDVFCNARTMAAERGCEVFEAEEELLGTSHAEIGAYLLGLWGLPNIAVEAIAHHHRPDRIPHSGFDCSVAVYMADLLDEELEAHPQDETGHEIAEPIRKCLEALDVLPRFAEFRELALQARR